MRWVTGGEESRGEENTGCPHPSFASHERGRERGRCICGRGDVGVHATGEQGACTSWAPRVVRLVPLLAPACCGSSSCEAAWGQGGMQRNEHVHAHLDEAHAWACVRPGSASGGVAVDNGCQCLSGTGPHVPEAACTRVCRLARAAAHPELAPALSEERVSMQQPARYGGRCARSAGGSKLGGRVGWLRHHDSGAAFRSARQTKGGTAISAWYREAAAGWYQRLGCATFTGCVLPRRACHLPFQQEIEFFVGDAPSERAALSTCLATPVDRVHTPPSSTPLIPTTSTAVHPSPRTDIESTLAFPLSSSQSPQKKKRTEAMPSLVAPTTSVSGMPTEIRFTADQLPSGKAATIPVLTFEQLEQFPLMTLKNKARWLVETIGESALPSLSGVASQHALMEYIMDVQISLCATIGLRVNKRNFGAPADWGTAGTCACTTVSICNDLR
jgi:hypothetical protein